jgi:LacI family transcriptional regulator
VRGDFGPQGGAAAMRALLRSARPPSAVFVCNDLMAIGALNAAHAEGVRVPRELSIVGFDDIELAAYTVPPLTTVAQPKEAIGTGAAQLLLERIRAGRSRLARKVLQPELRVRESTAAAPGLRAGTGKSTGKGKGRGAGTRTSARAGAGAKARAGR